MINEVVAEWMLNLLHKSSRMYLEKTQQEREGTPEASWSHGDLEFLQDRMWGREVAGS